MKPFPDASPFFRKARRLQNPDDDENYRYLSPALNTCFGQSSTSTRILCATSHLVGSGEAGVDCSGVVAAPEVEVAVTAAAVVAVVILVAVAAPELPAQVAHLHRQVPVHRVQVRADAAQLFRALLKEDYSIKCTFL